MPGRALAALDVAPDLVILDGPFDWLSDPARLGLLALAHGPGKHAVCTSGAAVFHYGRLYP